MKHYFKLFTATVLILFQASVSALTSGMWIPMLLEQINEKEMHDIGMRITAKDIYDNNNSSMKDAILLFGRGFTAEIISDEGIILTNHHCCYRAIQSHTTIEHDYLTDGFWAMNREEELSNPSLKVTRFVPMVDDTDQMFLGVEVDMTQKLRDSVLKVNGDKIKGVAEKDKHYKAYLRPFYYGNEFCLCVTEIVTDIRLVVRHPQTLVNLAVIPTTVCGQGIPTILLCSASM